MLLTWRIWEIKQCIAIFGGSKKFPLCDGSHTKHNEETRQHGTSDQQGLCINLEGRDAEGDGREVQEGGDICIPMTDSC